MQTGANQIITNLVLDKISVAALVVAGFALLAARAALIRDRINSLRGPGTSK